MHYKDGTPAQIGDVVRGTGYNVKHEIVGTVVGLTPNSQSCNIQVAHVCHQALPGLVPPPHRLYHQVGVRGCGADGGRHHYDRNCEGCDVGAWVDMEYGQCDGFTLLMRALKT